MYPTPTTDLQLSWLTVIRLATWLNKPRGKKHYAKMINDFDKLKCNFKGSRQTIFAEVSATGLSNDDAKGVADQFMAISGQDLQEIFEPVIKEIIRLIQEQIDKVIEADMHVSVRKVSCLRTKKCFSQY